MNPDVPNIQLCMVYTSVVIPMTDMLDSCSSSYSHKLDRFKGETVWSFSGIPWIVLRNLDVYVDGELSMKDHINKLARTFN